MPIKNGKITRTIFAARSFPVTATLNPSFNEQSDDKTNAGQIGILNNDLYYSKENGLRKSVEWDFGDGYTGKGQMASHNYTLPGKYRISCTFYDMDRRAITNTYTVDVIVKDIAPTTLTFVNDDEKDIGELKPFDEDLDLSDIGIYKKEIVCSKIDKIAKIRATLSAWVQTTPSIIPTRILSDLEKGENTYYDIKDYQFNHLHQYYAFLNKTKESSENNMGYTNDLYVVDRYMPDYVRVYGKFVVEDDKPKLEAYVINPYTTGNNQQPFYINDPMAEFDEDGNIEQIEINITEVSTEEEMPSRVHLLFYRGYTDIYYKSDYPNYGSVHTQISFELDFESAQIMPFIVSSPNFTTQVPLVRELKVTETPYETPDNKFIRFALTSTGFLWNKKGEVEHDINKITVDKHLQEMLIKGYDCPVIMIPYILDEDGYSPNGYYIPKDLSYVMNAEAILDSDTFLYLLKSEELSILPYVKYFELRIGEIINIAFDIAYQDSSKSCILYSGAEEYDHNVRYVRVIDHLKINIPKEKLVDLDVPRLINTYTPHVMFKETQDLKQYLIDIFRNRDMLAYIITRSLKFVDDNVNKDRNYIDKLVSMLQSIGLDVAAYEESSFSNVNELRDFTRILSMNHTELVGNVISETLDIKITPSYKGKHVGSRIYVTDKIQLNAYNEIVGIKRPDKDGWQYLPVGQELWSEWIVVEEDYSHRTRLASFHSAFPNHEHNDFYVSNPDFRPECDCVREVGFDEYVEEWGWNLLLSKADPGVDLLNKIDTYYTFYLLNPSGEQKRIGNFIDEKYLTNDILDKDSWYDEWGITLDIVIKIILQAFDFEREDIVEQLGKAQGTTVFSFLLPDDMGNTRDIKMSQIMCEIFGDYNARSIPSTHKFNWDDTEERTLVNINRLDTTIVRTAEHNLLHKLEIFGDMRGLINNENKYLTSMYYRAMYIKSPDMIGVIYVLRNRTMETKYPQSIMMEFRDDDPFHM